MPIAKFDLYKNEWLELVFSDRNKTYGAYDLRKHYSSILLKAMGIAFTTVILLFWSYSFYLGHKTVETIVNVPYHPTIVAPPNEVKPIIPPRTQTVTPPAPAHTVRYPLFKVTNDKIAENPPKITDLQTAAISTKNQEGKDGTINLPTDGSDGSGVKPNVIEDDKPKETYDIQVMPTPFGGETAWAKFLQKNLHYPSQAIEAHASGKVYLSFVVEKDGHISNITVERGLGYGLDEEAVRVLKLAPAWKPGIQNGHPVRVRFVMPINFQITDDND